jgi:hypothetical protein
MKTLSKSLSLLILLAILIPITLIGEEYTKKVSGKYSVNPNAQLVIKNKFGEVHCQNWSEPSVSIEVTVTVDASSQERANKILDRVSVSLTGTADKVEAITNISEMGSNNVEFSVDYLVMMPKNVRLDLDNRFGETYIAEVEGSSKVEIQYGELEAQSFRNSSNVIVVKFSDAQIGYLEGAEVEVAYSEMEMTKGNSLKVNSSFSEVDMGSFKNFDIISKYDDIQIGEASSIACQAKFAEVNVESISGAFSFNVEYGGLDIESLSSSFGSGKIINAFNDVNIGLKPDVSLNLDAEADYGEVDYPSGKSKISTQEVNYTKNIYKGTIGSSTSPANQLYIRSRNASVDIDYND